MNTAVKRVIQIAFIVFVVGILLAGAVFAFAKEPLGVSWYNGGWHYNYAPVERVIIDETLEAFSSIEIETFATEVSLVPGETFAIKYSGDSRNGTPQHTVADGLLTVSRPLPQQSWEISISTIILTDSPIYEEGNKLTIYYPKDEPLESVNVVTSSGNLEVSNMIAEKISLDCRYGNTTLEDIKADKLTIDLSSETLAAHAVTADNLTVVSKFGTQAWEQININEKAIFDLSSESISLEALTMDQLFLSSEYSSIDGNDLVSMDTELILTSTDFMFAGDFQGNLVAKSSYGNTHLALARPESEYSSDIEIKYGSIYIDGEAQEEEYYRSSDKKDNSITISATSGEVMLDFQE